VSTEASPQRQSSGQRDSFTPKFLRTYFWHGLAIPLNIASMFVVIPLISDRPVVFGVYSVCISTAMFLSYADLGFVAAGIKYAGESYGRHDLAEELRFHGFYSFILSLLVAALAFAYLVFAYNPSLLIRDVSGTPYLRTASQLLLIQAAFAPSTVLQRFVVAVFQIRIERYVFQPVDIAGSLLKIASVFYFFSPGRYEIVGYFLFCKVIELLVSIVGLAIIRYKYGFSLRSLLAAYRFDRAVFRRTRGLAFSSLFATLMFILYFEMDIIAIGMLFGAESVAIYAIGFTMVKFLRTMSGTLFSPFQARFNHLVGVADLDSLRLLLYRVVRLSLPVFVLPVLSIVWLSDSIAVTWAGSDYLPSAAILRLLSMNYMFSFVVIPCGMMLVVLERIRDMYWMSALRIVVFWGGIFAARDYLGVDSVAVFKLLAGLIIVVLYTRMLLALVEIDWAAFLADTIGTMLLPIAAQSIFLALVADSLPAAKAATNLLIVIAAGGVAATTGAATLLLTSAWYRNEVALVWQHRRPA